MRDLTQAFDLYNAFSVENSKADKFKTFIGNYIVDLEMHYIRPPFETEPTGFIRIADKQGNILYFINNIQNVLFVRDNCIAFSKNDIYHLIIFKDDGTIRLVNNVAKDDNIFYDTNWVQIFGENEKVALLNVETLKYLELDEKTFGNFNSSKNLCIFFGKINKNNKLKINIVDKNLNVKGYLENKTLRAIFSKMQSCIETNKKVKIRSKNRKAVVSDGESFFYAKRPRSVKYSNLVEMRLPDNRNVFVSLLSGNKIYFRTKITNKMYKNLPVILSQLNVFKENSNNTTNTSVIILDTDGKFKFQIIDDNAEILTKKDIILDGLLDVFNDIRNMAEGKNEKLDTKKIKKKRDSNLNAFIRFMEENIQHYTYKDNKTLIAVNHIGIFDEKGNLLHPLKKWEFAVPGYNSNYVYILKPINMEKVLNEINDKDNAVDKVVSFSYDMYLLNLENKELTKVRSFKNKIMASLVFDDFQDKLLDEYTHDKSIYEYDMLQYSPHNFYRKLPFTIRGPYGIGGYVVESDNFFDKAIYTCGPIVSLGLEKIINKEKFNGADESFIIRNNAFYYSFSFENISKISENKFIKILSSNLLKTAKTCGVRYGILDLNNSVYLDEYDEFDRRKSESDKQIILICDTEKNEIYKISLKDKSCAENVEIKDDIVILQLWNHKTESPALNLEKMKFVISQIKDLQVNALNKVIIEEDFSNIKNRSKRNRDNERT